MNRTSSLLLVALVLGTGLVFFFSHSCSRTTAGSPCDKIVNENTCNNADGCVWCVSYAIPSACYSKEDAANLPQPVFKCDAPSVVESLQKEEKKTSLQKTNVLTEEIVKVRPEVTLTVTMHQEDQLCDPDVLQYSGYFTIAGTKKHYFFWFFESRSKPESDPLTLWLTGGPGCSSEVALFGENGPCSVNKQGDGTELNPHSWNSNSNLLYVDQPSGTGFSYGDETTHDEAGVSECLYLFITEFLKQYPKYQKSPFNLFGESYAGHYVPATAHRIWKGNKNQESDVVVNLKGVAVGNGMSNPLLQFPAYPEFAYHSDTTPKVVSYAQYLQMKADVPVCSFLIKTCLSTGLLCETGLAFCETQLIAPMQMNGWNQYDARIKCAVPPLCYDFSSIGKFLHRADVREKLGVPTSVPQWEDCNYRVNGMFHKDWLHNFDFELIDLLEDGIDVLIYAGDCDYICNWLGNKEWVTMLEWSGRDAFNLAKDEDWNNGAGELRRHKTFSFLRVHKAGHMVPMDQPEASLKMLNDFIFKKGSWGSQQEEAV